ncbi:MAG: hypothetical protein VKI63_05990 [Cyanobium sp.]|nr:hypothetical protein [Cyanobium sp.]
MTFNVPGSTVAWDEFRFPGGGWCSIDRSVTFDSSLRWRDVLTTPPASRSLLTSEQVGNIGRLARLMHAAERILLKGKAPLESPFKVLQWWDPAAKDWHHGRRCCLRLQGLPLLEFIAALPGPDIRTAIRSGDTFEAIIPRRSGRGSRLAEPAGAGQH